MSDYKTFEEASANDPILYGVACGRWTPEQAMIAMANRHKATATRMMDLAAIAPFKARLPDGKIMIWRCPDELVPEPKG